MGLYDSIKDVARIAQQADNIELYRKLIEISAQALDMQDEIRKLKEENEELRKAKENEQDIEYHVDAYLTKRTDTKPIKYCAACWVDKKKLVPIQSRTDTLYTCPLCNAKIYKSDKRAGRYY